MAVTACCGDGTRIEQRSAAFRNAANEPMQMVASSGVEPFLRLYNHAIYAVDAFGRAELHFRQAERLETLGVDSGTAEDARAWGQRYQEQGFRQMNRANETIEPLREALHEGKGDGGEFDYEMEELQE